MKVVTADARAEVIFLMTKKKEYLVLKNPRSLPILHQPLVGALLHARDCRAVVVAMVSVGADTLELHVVDQIEEEIGDDPLMSIKI